MSNLPPEERKDYTVSDRIKCCPGCGESKPVTEFYKQRSSGDGLKARCKSCNNAATAVWKKANPEKVKAWDAAYRAANREKRRAASAAWYAANSEKTKAAAAALYASRRRFIDAIKLTAGCVDCGYNEVASGLEFDHVRGEKSFGIGENWSRPLPALMAEVEKCEIRCRSCHTARHYLPKRGATSAA